FGTKAGDTFTRITSYTALIWMTICVLASLYFSRGTQSDAFSAVDQQRALRTAPAGAMGGNAEADDPASPSSAGGTQAPATGDASSETGTGSDASTSSSDGNP